MKWSGQTKAEFQKNYKRVQDMLEKAPGDKEKQESLATTQAKLITDEKKALNRAMAAKELGQMHIYDIFFQRAYELGSVSTQDFREYQLEKLGI